MGLKRPPQTVIRPLDLTMVTLTIMVGLSLGIIQLVKLLKRLQLIWYWFDGGQGETTACWGQRIHWALLQPAIVKKEAPQWEQEGETLAGRRKTCHVCRRHQYPGVQQHSGPEVQEKDYVIELITPSSRQNLRQESGQQPTSAPDGTWQHQMDWARGLSNSRRFRIQAETTAECAYGT